MQWNNALHSLAPQGATSPREATEPPTSPESVAPVDKTSQGPTATRGEKEKPVDQPVRTQPPIPVPEKVDEAIQDLVEEVMERLLHGHMPTDINRLDEERTAKVLLNVYG